MSKGTIPHLDPRTITFSEMFYLDKLANALDLGEVLDWQTAMAEIGVPKEQAWDEKKIRATLIAGRAIETAESGKDRITPEGEDLLKEVRYQMNRIAERLGDRETSEPPKASPANSNAKDYQRAHRWFQDIGTWVSFAIFLLFFCGLGLVFTLPPSAVALFKGIGILFAGIGLGRLGGKGIRLVGEVLVEREIQTNRRRILSALFERQYSLGAVEIPFIEIGQSLGIPKRTTRHLISRFASDGLVVTNGNKLRLTPVGMVDGNAEHILQYNLDSKRFLIALYKDAISADCAIASADKVGGSMGFSIDKIKSLTEDFVKSRWVVIIPAFSHTYVKFISGGEQEVQKEQRNHSPRTSGWVTFGRKLIAITDHNLMGNLITTVVVIALGIWVLRRTGFNITDLSRSTVKP